MCAAFQSLSSDNDFLGFVRVDDKSRRQLGLNNTVTLPWIWFCNEMIVSQAAKSAGVAKMTASERFPEFREVGSDTEMLLPNLAVTPSEPIQVDESYFPGSKNYKRGRLQRGDAKAPNKRERWDPRGLFSSEEEEDLTAELRKRFLGRARRESPSHRKDYKVG